MVEGKQEAAGAGQLDEASAHSDLQRRARHGEWRVISKLGPTPIGAASRGRPSTACHTSHVTRRVKLGESHFASCDSSKICTLFLMAITITITIAATAAFTCIAWHATLWSRAESAAQYGDDKDGDGADADGVRAPMAALTDTSAASSAARSRTAAEESVARASAAAWGKGPR